MVSHTIYYLFPWSQLMGQEWMRTSLTRKPHPPSSEDTPTLHIVSKFRGIATTHPDFGGRAKWVGLMCVLGCVLGRGVYVLYVLCAGWECVLRYLRHVAIFMCVHVYGYVCVLDIHMLHTQGVDYVDSPSPMTDLNGHGTHVAGTLMVESRWLG